MGFIEENEPLPMKGLVLVQGTRPTEQPIDLTELVDTLNEMGNDLDVSRAARYGAALEDAVAYLMNTMLIDRAGLLDWLEALEEGRVEDVKTMLRAGIKRIDQEVNRCPVI